MDSVVVSVGEWTALVKLVKDFANARGEDTMGAILLTSGHRYLSDGEVVDLGHKIDQTNTYWQREDWLKEVKE